MKKLLVTVLLNILLFSLASCSKSQMSGNIADCAEAVDSSYINFEVIDFNYRDGWTILYDKNTKVMYIILDGYQSTGMTPILNADGTPKLYEGD